MRETHGQIFEASIDVKVFLQPPTEVVPKQRRPRVEEAHGRVFAGRIHGCQATFAGSLSSTTACSTSNPAFINLATSEDVAAFAEYRRPTLTLMAWAGLLASTRNSATGASSFSGLVRCSVTTYSLVVICHSP